MPISGYGVLKAQVVGWQAGSPHFHIQDQTRQAQADPQARVNAFGQRSGPEPGRPDQAFHFQPGNGVHDIHMNQGNDARFAGDNGTYQDGALFFSFAQPCDAGPRR